MGYAQRDVAGQGAQAGHELFGAVPVFTLRISGQGDHFNRRFCRGFDPLAIECERRTVKGQRHLPLRADAQDRRQGAFQIKDVRQYGKAVLDGREQLTGVDIAARHEPRAEQEILLEEHNAFSRGADPEFIVISNDAGQFCQ